jgi:hypothetical protein
LFHIWKMWTLSNSGCRRRIHSIWVFTPSRLRSAFWFSLWAHSTITSGPRMPPSSSARAYVSIPASELPPAAVVRRALGECACWKRVAMWRKTAAATSDTTSTATVATRPPVCRGRGASPLRVWPYPPPVRAVPPARLSPAAGVRVVEPVAAG